MPDVFERSVAGRTLGIQVGKFAHQANGAVAVQYGSTVVLVTACSAAEPREGIDFVPLTVDYEERSRYNQSTHRSLPAPSSFQEVSL